MGSFPLGALLGVVGGLRGALRISGNIILVAFAPLVLALRHTRDVEELPSWHTEPEHGAVDGTVVASR